MRGVKAVVRVLLVLLVIGVIANCADEPTAPERGVARQGTIAFATAADGNGLSITTDKDDYAPGDTVWFTGAGWTPEDSVDIVLVDDPTGDHHNWTVGISADGTFRDSTYVVDVNDLGVTFTLTATSRQNPQQSLTVTFTDGTINLNSNPAGISYDVIWTEYNSATVCDGTTASGPTNLTVAAGGGGLGNINQNHAVKVVAAATAKNAPNGAFISWSGPAGTFTVGSDTKEICIPGFSNPPRGYTAAYQAPDLSIEKSHTGDFTKGSDHSYTMTVTNAGSAATSGTITVTDNLPSQLTFLSASGTGWTCSGGAPGATCTRTAAIPAGSSAPAITLNVSVGKGGGSSVTNQASVSGGGEPSGSTSNNSASDPTTLISAPPTALVFSTAAFSVAANTCSSAITVQTRNQFGQPVKPDAAVLVNLSSTGGGSFYATAGCAGSPINQVTIATSANNQSFFYKDGTCGTPTITAQDNATVLTQATQQEEITGCATNAAPTVSAGGPYSGSEGSAIDFASGSSQPSATDGDGDALLYKWTYTAGAGVDAAATCSFSDDAILKPTITCTDNGTFTAKLEVDDQHGHVVSSNATVNVSNANPTATGLSTNSPVDEGSDIVFSLTGATDASSVDATSLRYAFDCGDGNGFSAATYAAASSTNSANCSTDDNGTRTVKGKVFDKDGGFSGVQSASVTINNVNPAIGTITQSDGSGLPTSVIVGATLEIKVPFTDPGTADTHKAKIDCGSGTYSDVNSGNDVVSDFTVSCTFSTVGSKTVRVKVIDDDGGYDVESFTVGVQYHFEGLFAPVDKPNTMNVSKVTQAIPLKWRLTDYQGQPILNFSATALGVAVASLVCDVNASLDQIEEYAGNSGLQNLGDGYYQFNWKPQANYANSCKSIGLDLGEGMKRGPLAYFNFKK